MAYLLVLLIFTLWGSFSYRWRGYGEGITQREIRRLSCILMPVAITLVTTSNPYIIAGVGLLSYLGIIVGHGRYFTLGSGPYPEREDNWPGKLIAPLKLERGYHDTLALSLTGLAFTIPTSAWLLINDLDAAYFLIMLAGALKPLGYWLAQHVNFPRVHDDHLFWAEVYYGAILGFLLGLAFIVV